MNKKYKKMSSHGSINIPVDMRREIGIQGGDAMEVTLEQGKVTVTPYFPRCMFCEGTKEVKLFHGKGVCSICANKILNMVLDDADKEAEDER